MNVVTLQGLADVAEFSMPAYKDKRFPPSIYYRFLQALAHHLQPQVCVELGLCGGGASLHMALGCPYSKVIGVDIVNSWPANIEHVKSTCANFEFWQMDSQEAATRYRGSISDPVGLLFIDTVHTYEHTLQEFNAWRDLLAVDAIVCFDDLKRPGMDRAWGELAGKKYRIDRLHIGGSPHDGGFGILYDIGR
jgi:cephalosporin hydroxylase